MSRWKNQELDQRLGKTQCRPTQRKQRSAEAVTASSSEDNNQIDPWWIANIRENNPGVVLRPSIDNMNHALSQGAAQRPGNRRALRSQRSLRRLRRASFDSGCSSLSSGSARDAATSVPVARVTIESPTHNQDRKPASRPPVSQVPNTSFATSAAAAPDSVDYYHSKPSPRCVSPPASSPTRAAHMPSQDTATLFRREDAMPPPPSARPLSSSGPKRSTKTVEISPGVVLPLRGADETWECIKDDFFVPVACFGCTAEVCCIQDARFVLCPECRVVSPMADAGGGTLSSGGGVGLGFSFEDLFKWQAELILEQRGYRGMPTARI